MTTQEARAILQVDKYIRIEDIVEAFAKDQEAEMAWRDLVGEAMTLLGIER